MRVKQTAVLGLVLTTLAGPASADLITVWLGGKADYVGGTGDVYKTFESSFGGGVEGGIELLGIDLWADFLAMGNSQYQSTLNLGFDIAVGDPVRFTFGAFTGPMFFFFPNAEVEPLTFTAGQRQQLIDAGVDVTRIEREYSKISDDEQTLSSLAAGWNLLRGQLQVEFKLAPVLYLGIGGELGYHFIISGEEEAAGAKNGVIDKLVKSENLTKAVADVLRTATGAREVDRNNLNGVNYNAGVFLRLEL